MDNPKALLQYHEIPRLKDKWRQMKGCTNSELGCLLGHVAGLEQLLAHAEKRLQGYIVMRTPGKGKLVRSENDGGGEHG